MSLDVYLYESARECECKGICPCHTHSSANELFSANITHNLGPMASEAGIYQACWRPEEIGIVKAGQLIPLLKKAIAEMCADPPRFKKHDAPNGWGLYDNFLPWLERYLEACRENPDATVRVSR